jgi:hypothetical protein
MLVVFMAPAIIVGIIAVLVRLFRKKWPNPLAISIVIVVVSCFILFYTAHLGYQRLEGGKF